MKVSHLNINGFADVDGTITGVVGEIVPVIIESGNRLNNIKIIKSLLISAVSTEVPVISLGFRFTAVYDSVVIQNAETRSLNASSDAARTDSKFYILKDMSLPIGSALDVVAGFPNGIPYSSNYDLFLTVAAENQSISVIIAYE